MADITPGARRRRKQRTSIIIAALVAVIVVVAGVFVVRSLSGGAGAPTASASTNTGKDAALADDPAVKKLNGTISFGTEGTYSPFSYHDQSTGELTGYDIEVAKAVTAKLGVKAKFVETQYDGIFAGLESSHYDGIANQVQITPEREQKYELTKTYAVSYPVVITRADETGISGIDDIKGRSAAQTEGSNWRQIAEEHGAKVQTVPGFSESVAAIEQKRVDLTVNDKLAAKDYLKTTGNANIRIAATDTATKLEQGFAFRKGSGLAEPVNKAIDALRADGTLAKLGEKYFGEDISK